MLRSLLCLGPFALMAATPAIAVPAKAAPFTVDVVPSFYISTLAPYVATFNCINDCLDGADCAALCLNKGHAGDYKREPLKWPNFDNLVKNIPNYVDTGVCITKCNGQDICINRCITARTPGKLAVVPELKDLPLQIPNIARGIFRTSHCNWNIDCMASAVYSMVTVPGQAHNGSRLVQRSEDIPHNGTKLVVSSVPRAFLNKTSPPVTVTIEISVGAHHENSLRASNDTTHVAIPKNVMGYHTTSAGVTKRWGKRGEHSSDGAAAILSRSANVTTSYRKEILDRLALHQPEVDAIIARCHHDPYCWYVELPDYMRKDDADRWRLKQISEFCGYVEECIEKEFDKDHKFLEDLKKLSTPPFWTLPEPLRPGEKPHTATNGTGH